MRILILLLLAVPAVAETVRFKTADDIEIVADYFKGKPGAASVVCIPMFRSDRKAYRPLVMPLMDKGFHVLLIDKRGHGESAPELAPRVKARDAVLFNAMHQDVAAAIAFLQKEKGCDVTRVGLVGASVGCSVAIDAAIRNTNAVRAVVVLTPGSNYLGVNTLEHLKRWPGTRIFTFVSSEEEKTSAGVIKALDPFNGSNVMVVPGTAIHGTRMFGKVGQIEELIANFMESSLKKSADIRVPVWPKDSKAPGSPGFFGKTLRLRRTVGGVTYSFMIYGVGDEWTLGGLVSGAFKGKVRIKVDGKAVDLPLDTSTRGGPIKAGGFAGHQASAGKTTWVLFNRPAPKKYAKLSVEFLPARSKKVRLPAKGDFAAIPQPVK